VRINFKATKAITNSYHPWLLRKPNAKAIPIPHPLIFVVLAEGRLAGRPPSTHMHAGIGGNLNLKKLACRLASLLEPF